MAQDLWSKPDENNTLGAGWENAPAQQGTQNPYETQQNGYQNAGYGYQQNGYRAGGAFAPDAFGQTQAAESLSTYIGKTFLWMFAGLLVTFVIAMQMVMSGLTLRMLYQGGTAVLVGVTIAELLVVVIMSARIRKISSVGAAVCFFIYAALTGVTFSMYFLIFDLQVLIYAFGATALFFGGMAAASLIFKMELSSLRPYLFGGLIFLVLFGILSMIFNLGAFNTMVCYIGIAIFLAYTAYDTAKIKQNYYYYQGNAELLKKASIFSALELYLDFVNLFLYILRIFGKNRN